MGKTLDKAREFEANSRRDAYKFWLGFFEKMFLLLLAIIIIPFSLETSEMPVGVLVFWISLCAGLFIGILIFGTKLFKLSLSPDGGDS